MTKINLQLNRYLFTGEEVYQLNDNRKYFCVHIQCNCLLVCLSIFCEYGGGCGLQWNHAHQDLTPSIGSK